MDADSSKNNLQSHPRTKNDALFLTRQSDSQSKQKKLFKSSLVEERFGIGDGEG
jgi:hypothetical protein